VIEKDRGWVRSKGWEHCPKLLHANGHGARTPFFVVMVMFVIVMIMFVAVMIAVFISDMCVFSFHNMDW
jgi:hypothetical protein